ncbi:MarR family transcriptional regulator [Pseudoflavonifractor sp. AF19-9AC]|nr:MarR family transcriptional regulator [Pseudoflavonifractor sp. AF19-9AC]
MEHGRKELLQKLWAAQDEAYELMAEYDSLPHTYGSVVLYQAEALVVNLIGEHSDITITELGSILKKTASACSQIVRKLKSKGLVEQVRNESNNRQLNLRLTDAGKQIYLDRLSLNLECQNILFRMLQEFSDEEIAHHIAVQERINQAYRGDIDRSKVSVTE